MITGASAGWAVGGVVEISWPFKEAKEPAAQITQKTVKSGLRRKVFKRSFGSSAAGACQ
jgi:hypothetical protein